MHYSFSTILMTILASNLIIVLITFCFRHRKIMLSIGYRLLAVFLVFTLIRFLFPFELPFTKSIYFSDAIFSKCIFYLQHPFYKIGFLKISLWSIFECVWFVGILVKLRRHIKDCRGSARFIAAHGRDVSRKEPYKTLLDDICGKRKNPFRVVLLSPLDVPQVYGILSPRILIPAHMELNREELYFVLHHEAYHYFHRDILIKEAVSLLCILYWWNPACKLFQEQVGLILEMHVDDSLASNHSDSESVYLHSLVHIMEIASGANPEVPSGLTVAIASKNSEELTKRFQMLCHKNKRKSIPLFLELLATVAFIYIGSYGIILEVSTYDFVDADTDTLGLTDASFYAVSKGNGSYEIYYNGILIETVESLEYYREIPVLPAE